MYRLIYVIYILILHFQYNFFFVCVCNNRLNAINDFCVDDRYAYLGQIFKYAINAID